MTIFLYAAVALFLALVGASRVANLPITCHARPVVEANSLELAASYAAVVAKVVSEPACTLASVNIARCRSISVVTN